MNKTELMKNAQTTLGQIFTKKRLKKAGADILICGILAAGGGWYHHQQCVHPCRPHDDDRGTGQPEQRCPA